LPHEPQFCVSDWVSTQAPRQSCPLVHPQVPFVQVCPLPHARPH
jgi:hypothetical protein